MYRVINAYIPEVALHFRENQTVPSSRLNILS
jgi:hypothetical protein